MSFPVSCLYTEISGSSVVECCSFGSFASDQDLLISTGDRLSLYSIVNESLIFVSETVLSARTHDMAVIRRPNESSLLIIAFRHGHVATLTFDPRSRSFYTKSVAACGEAEGRLGKLRVCERTRSAAALHSAPETLSVLSIVGETLTLTAKLSIPHSLGFAVLSDFAFSDDQGYGPEVALACVGQLKAKCWVGRKEQSKSAGGLKVFSMNALLTTDTATPGLLWELLSLPHSVFRVLPVKIGWLCISPDALVFSAEFADAVGFRVNQAEWELSGELQRLVPVKECLFSEEDREPDGDLSPTLHLDGCGVAISDSTVILSLPDGSLVTCALERSPNGLLSAVHCRRELRATWAQAVCSAEGWVFLGSRLGDSMLHKLIPRIVDGQANDVSIAVSETPIDSAAAALLKAYATIQPSPIHTLSVLPATETVQSCGLVRYVTPYPSDVSELALLSCGGGETGRLALVSPGQLPAEEVVGTRIPDQCIAAVAVRTDPQTCHVLLSLQNSTSLRVDLTTGVKASGTLPFSFLAGTDLGNGFVLLVTQTDLVVVDLAGQAVGAKDSSLSWRSVFGFGATPTGSASIAIDGTGGLVVAVTGVGVFRVTWKSSEFFIQQLDQFTTLAQSSKMVTASSMGHSDVWVLFALLYGSIEVHSLRSGQQTRYHLVAGLPPILSSDESLASCSSSLTDPSAPAVEAHPGAAVLAEKAKINILASAVLGLVPVLMVGIEGRPLAVYRGSCMSRGQSISLSQVSFVLDTALLLHSRAPIIPSSYYCSPCYGSFGRKAQGIFIAGLFITCDSRGQLFACGSTSQTIPSISLPISPQFAPNSLLLIESKRFRILSEFVVGGEDEEEDSLIKGATTSIEWRYESRQGPHALVALTGVPHRTSCTESGIVAVALARKEVDLGEQQASAVAIVEDEAADDMDHQGVDGFTTIAAAPAIVAADCAIPRMRSRYEVVVFSSDLSTVLGSITLNPDEQVMGLDWLADTLMIGTAFQSSEDTPGRGRVIALKVNGQVIVASEKKTGVTCLRVWRDMVAVGLGWKMMLYKLNGSTFVGCGMYDVAMHTTAVGFAKQFMLAGDLLRGMHFMQFREDHDGTHKNVLFLAKSTPFIPITILGCECVQLGGSVPTALGLIGVDDRGNLHVMNFSLETGVTLRQCSPFSLDSIACIATKRGVEDPLGGFPIPADHALVSLTNGTLARLTVMTPPDFHLAASLASVMITLLPFSGGLNPRLAHAPVGSVFKKQVNQMLLAGQGVESGRLLQQFLWLSVPLQAEIAERLNLPVDLLCELVRKWC